jgi:hypothetical protein
MKQHCHPGTNQLDDERDGIARVMGNIGWNGPAVGFEPGANPHLHGRDIIRASRPIQIYPMFAVIESEKHRRITAGRDHSIRRRAFSDLVVSQQ